MTQIELILSKLPGAEEVKPGCWKALCPAHSDNKPSLSVDEGSEGRVLVTCRAGCPTVAVLSAIGLTLADLMPKVDRAVPKRIKGRVIATYPFTDESGVLIYRVERDHNKEFWPSRPDGRGGWISDLKGVRRVPYRLPAVLDAVVIGATVYIVEGEKDADNLVALGFCVTTSSGGSGGKGIWPQFPPIFRGANICILPDNDKSGRDYAVAVGTSLETVAASIRVLELPGLPNKGDVSDWIAASGTADKLLALLESSSSFSDWVSTLAKSQGADEACPDLPVIETNNRQQREISGDIFKALLAANDPPRLFVRSGQLVRIGKDENDRPKPETVDEDVLAHMATRSANFISISDKRGKIAVKPPSFALNDLLHAPSWPGVPPLAGIVTSPVVGPDGQLVMTPGYMPGAKLYYHEGQHFDLPDTTPTPQSVRSAVLFLADTLLGDFPFVHDEDGGQSSRANALGLLLLPFVRPYIDGPTPLHLIDAPAKGTGKTLLGRILTSVFLPGGPPLASAPTNRADDEEWRKKLTSALKAGGPFCFIDNIAGRLESPSLDLVLTAREWTDRELGKLSMVTLPVLCVFIGTANNVVVLEVIRIAEQCGYALIPK